MVKRLPHHGREANQTCTSHEYLPRTLEYILSKSKTEKESHSKIDSKKTSESFGIVFGDIK